MEDQEDQVAPNQLALSKMCLTAGYYSVLSPALSRFSLEEAARLKQTYGLPQTPARQACPFCHQIFRPDNSIHKVIPRLKLTRKIGKLKRKVQRGDTLGKFQQNMLNLYTEGNNRMVIKCLTCNHSVQHKCYPRPKKEKKVLSEPVELTKSQKKRQKRKRKHKEEGDDESDLSSSLLLQREKGKSAVSSRHLESKTKDLPNELAKYRTMNIKDKPLEHQIKTSNSQSPAAISPRNVSKEEESSKSGKKKKIKTKRKDRDSFNILQGMLKQEKQDRERSKGTNALQGFLSSL